MCIFAPCYLQLDAKKSPLALLAQTCSQIGKPDPPPSSKLSSISSGGHADKESSSRSSSSSLKLGEHRPAMDDKSSFKPYSKVGPDCRRDGVSSTSSSSGGSSGGGGGSSNASDKAGFRVPHNSTGCSSFPPHAVSPNARVTSGSPLPSHMQSHRQTQSPSTQSTPHSQMVNGDHKSADSTNSDGGSNNGKKEAELSGKGSQDGAQLANSSHARASVNSSNSSSDSSPHREAKADSQSSQPSLGPGHIAPISPFKSGHSVFPLPSSGLGYHGSLVGAYAGYPSQYVPGLDPTKPGLGGGSVGVPGKHPSSSPLTGASPPSFMQGLCRDPYCLSYPNAPHLGGSSCTSCIHDPSSPSASAALKTGFHSLVYPGHPLHSLHHTGALSSAVTPSALSHPLYTYGFVLPNEPLPHACNWVSAGVGPCDKRFATSEELLAHLRTHTTSLPSSLDSAKLLSAAYPSAASSSAAAAAAAAAACHLHLPQSSAASMPSSFSLRAPPSLGLARYHPYGKVPLPAAAPTLPMHSLPAGAPYYSHYALYGQRLGSASALGYQ